MPLDREEWLDLARALDWTPSYVTEQQLFPHDLSGEPWLPAEAWASWDEPYRTTYAEYVASQADKERAVAAVREAVGRRDDYQRLDRGWMSAVKLHTASFALAEMAATVGNLRATRFGRASAWRNTAALGALDELRHTQIPLLVYHELLRADPQLDWTHRLFHTNDWVAIAGRHLVDELLLTADPIEMAIGTHFVFETGFTNLQFVALSADAHASHDRMFERMTQTIQTDEARHAQIGPAVLKILVQHDRARAQYLVDKWFWRSWLFFAVVTGFAMDYLTPLHARRQSFRELMDEWVISSFSRHLAEAGLELPWYWPQLVQAKETYHHQTYVAAYTYRATVWFDMVMPGTAERAWLRAKYPRTWGSFDPLWERLAERWRDSGPSVEWHTHGVTPVGFCALCQLVLTGGTPAQNSARVVELDGDKSIFCSEPCEWIYRQETARYRGHRDVVKRILAGDAPANLLELCRGYFGLDQSMWGKDAHARRGVRP